MKRRLVIIICALLFVNNGYTAENGGIADFFSELDKALDTLCNTVAPTTNDTVTGRKTLNSFSREQQTAEGNAHASAYVKELQKQNIRINDFNPWMYRRVSRIAERVLAVSHLRNERWSFVLVNDPEFNAFVTGGSVLFINRGAVENSSDDEIAAVIGHEIAHVAANHVFEQISHSNIAKTTGSKSARREWFQVAFGHNQEIEADKYGLLYATLAGYDPFVAPELWERILYKYGNGGGFMRNHPANSERMQLTERFARKWNPYHISGKQNSNFVRILESQKETNISDNTAVGKGGGVAGCADTYLNAKQQHESAKREEQRQRQQYQAAQREQQRQQMEDIARVAFANKVSQLISINSMYVLSPTALHIDFNYSGNKSVHIEMIAVLTEIDKNSKTSTWILNPGTWITPSYSVVLEFDSPVFSNWRYGEKIPENYLNNKIRVQIMDAKLANS